MSEIDRSAVQIEDGHATFSAGRSTDVEREILARAAQYIELAGRYDALLGAWRAPDNSVVDVNLPQITAAAFSIGRQDALSCTSTRAAIAVLAERGRQITQEGRTPEHDDSLGHSGGLGVAAACYALMAAFQTVPEPSWQRRYSDAAYQLWPWDSEYLKIKSSRRNLVRAGALILAEIERLDRAQEAG